MSNNPFGLNNWLGHDGDGGTATKDVFQIGRNNRIHSPDDTNKRSNTDLGATIIDVRTPQNAALIGNNACITDPCVGVYGHCDGLGAGVAGACDAGCGVGIAIKDNVSLPPVPAGVFGIGDNIGVFAIGGNFAVEGDCNNQDGSAVFGLNTGARAASGERAVLVAAGCLVQDCLTARGAKHLRRGA